MRSVKGKFIFAVAFIYITSLLLVSIVSYTLSYNFALTSSKDKLRETSEKYAHEIEVWINSQSTQLHSIKEDIEARNHLDKAYLKNYFRTKSKDTNGVVRDYYIGFSDKSFISGSGQVPPHGYDFTTRDWYKTAAEKQRLIFDTPYVDEVNSEVVMTIAEPLVMNGKVIGVIGADIIIDHLVILVDNIRIAPNSYAFLLNTDKGFITHIRSDFLPTADQILYLDEVLGGRFKNVSSQIAPHMTSITQARDFDTLNKYFVTTTIDGSLWSLCFAVPKRELTNNLLLLLAVFMGISILSIIVSVFAVIIIINSLLKPLEQPRRFNGEDFKAYRRF